MKLVIITGGIACGKSTVCDYIAKEYGITIIDSDKITHEIQEPGGLAYDKIVKAFGEKYLNPDKTINRKELGNLVFSDFSQRRILNRIVHPLVQRKILCESLKCWFLREKIVLIEIPLFFEIHMKKTFFDEILTVDVKPDVQLERLLKRNDITVEAAQARVKSQFPPEKRISQSTFVVENGSNFEDTKKQIDLFIKKVNSQSPIITKYPDPVFLLFLLISLIVLIISLRKN